MTFSITHFVRTAACALSLLTGLSVSNVSAAETRYPLTLQNCGRQITFAKPPQRAVSLGQSSTEILYLLGLSKQVVGTAVWLGPVLKGYEEANATVPRLADNDPSFESVIGKKPDLVTVQFQWHVGPKGTVGTIAQFQDLGVPVYTSPSDCIGKDNSSGGDGVRADAFTMDLIYQEIRDLAAIFNVGDRGEEVVADLKAREVAARNQVAAAKGKLSAVFWFSSAQLAVDPYVAGKNGAPGYIMAALGIRNVVESDEEWPTVGWETIAKADPSLIVVARMERRRFPADDISVKYDFLKSDPVASLMPAVKAGHVVELDAQSMNPTIRTIDGIEALASAISKAGLSR
ncbi:ABC transporter substrate-binding protein [Rhizobium sp. FY34]|uniref:ABC transporter substrate-binding protein n=1 Tax=Rhizobium sp. FY34 TaxID=2562309 RepID=UPI0010C0D080|nr:ABC transporter substrate-binding protein [Rhizobium sp. FY34]